MSTPVGCQRGLGLCLSGGGFRASFYHIGVLIQMAEQGLLRHVEVISTVSGGSIVGAAYYLKLKKLLESKPDGEIFDNDYLTLAHELEKEFLEAVQNNLRMRTFSDVIKNLKMMKPNYSRSDAIAELYEEFIYHQYLKPEAGNKWIAMRNLLINPNKESIHPCDSEKGNAKRVNKVPVIILNATSLNSGHNWYFSGRSMGEVPPRNSIFKDLDKKDRYRRVRYDDIEGKQKNFPLASAVAASAGVPGVFPPMAVSELYKDRRVQLVDGGVFDNQGISGALDRLHECRYFVVSDASGQSDAVENPSPEMIKVVTLTNSIMMGRIREEVVNGLNETTKNPDARPQNMAFFHLTRGLEAKSIDPDSQGNGQLSLDKQRTGIISSLDDFGVHQDMQHALAHIRTDLDSFTDVEAGCLIADGFLMSKISLENLKQAIPENDPHKKDDQKPEEWLYQNYVDRLKDNNETVLKHLQIAKSKFFKPYIHMFKGTLNFGKSMGLVLVSLPVILALLAVLWGINELMGQYMDFTLLSIVKSVDAFTGFITLLAPGIYWLIVIKLISLVADRLIEGSGKVIQTIKKILKLPMTIVSIIVLRIVLPLISALFIKLYLVTIDKYYVKVIGKLA